MAGTRNGTTGEGRVRFVLINPEAYEVFVAGSFNNWNPGATSLIDVGHGHWVKELVLPPGRYEYQFVVDGRWMQDRTAKETVVNPFGGINSVVEIPQPQFKVPRLSSARKRVNRKWAWHYRALLALHNRLLKDRGEQLREVAEPMEPHSMDIADSATDQFDHDLALSELSAEQDALYEVDQALQRILDGTYGRCEASGKPISASRLRAVPWTRFSKEVEVNLERRGIVPRTHLGELASVRHPVVGN